MRRINSMKRIFSRSKQNDILNDDVYAEKMHQIGVGKDNRINRERWLQKTLKSIKKGSTILDAGAGELQYKKYCKHLKYISQDFAQYDGQGDEAGLQMGGWDNSRLDIVSDITSIPRKPSSFDAIMCIEVFEHIPDPVGAIKEFKRLLKARGKLVLTVPTASLTHFAPYYFTAGYSKYFFEHHLIKNGFIIKEISYNGGYFDYVAQELIRLEDMAKQYAAVKTPFGFETRQSILSLLSELKALSLSDSGSSELLSYGLHVVAEKGKK